MLEGLVKITEGRVSPPGGVGGCPARLREIRDFNTFLREIRIENFFEVFKLQERFFNTNPSI